MDTMKDPEFVADAKKGNLEIDPTSGEDVGKAVDSLFQLEPSLVVKMKTILLAINRNGHTARLPLHRCARIK